MKLALLFLFVFGALQADTVEDSNHELYLTLYTHSTHWTKNDSTGEEYNEAHKAYGAEYINDDKYSLSYNHFINSRGNQVDAYGLGYLFYFNDSLGLQLVGGYQEGYCFDGLLNSVECAQDENQKSAFVLPLLYYKHKYFKIDFFSNGSMFTVRLNIKIYNLF
jgi:hypothetical protein